MLFCKQGRQVRSYEEKTQMNVGSPAWTILRAAAQLFGKAASRPMPIGAKMMMIIAVEPVCRILPPYREGIEQDIFRARTGPRDSCLARKNHVTEPPAQPGGGRARGRISGSAAEVSSDPDHPLHCRQGPMAASRPQASFPRPLLRP